MSATFFGQWRSLLWFTGLCFLWSCQSTTNTGWAESYVEIRGETMGTYYQLNYRDTARRNLTAEIDTLLLRLNQEVSTYIPSSTISVFNQSASGIPIQFNPFGESHPHDNLHLIKNLQASKDISARTDGAFDPTVMPLVNYWGFGYTEKRPVTQVDSSRIDSLMQFVGVEKVRLAGDSLRKGSAGVQLDFSAIAKGYGVDLIGQYLSEQGIADYYVEIGGEVRTQGQSPRQDAWRVGISDPREEAGLQDIQTSVPLVDQALATSGNYRNVYEVDGQKFSHTINPRTGFPERSRLLSASVFAPDCMTADAYATACMVAGADRALEFAQENDQIEVYLIVGTESGDMEVRYSMGLQQFFQQ